MCSFLKPLSVLALLSFLHNEQSFFAFGFLTVVPSRLPLTQQYPASSLRLRSNHDLINNIEHLDMMQDRNFKRLSSYPLWMTAENDITTTTTNNSDKHDKHNKKTLFEMGAEKIDDDDIIISEDEIMPSSPPLSFGKFLTMQEKRVVLTIRYTPNSGLRPYYLTAAKRIKSAFPDVLIEKEILPEHEIIDEDDCTFEILVENKLLVGNKNKRQKGGERCVFVSMEELDAAIKKARRRRRPTTLYAAAGDGDDGSVTKARLEILRTQLNNQKDDE